MFSKCEKKSTRDSLAILSRKWLCQRATASLNEGVCWWKRQCKPHHFKMWSALVGMFDVGAQKVQKNKIFRFYRLSNVFSSRIHAFLWIVCLCLCCRDTDNSFTGLKFRRNSFTALSNYRCSPSNVPLHSGRQRPSRGWRRSVRIVLTGRGFLIYELW